MHTCMHCASVHCSVLDFISIFCNAYCLQCNICIALDFTTCALRSALCTCVGFHHYLHCTLQSWCSALYWISLHCIGLSTVLDFTSPLCLVCAMHFALYWIAPHLVALELILMVTASCYLFHCTVCIKCLCVIYNYAAIHFNIYKVAFMAEYTPPTVIQPS